MGLKGLSLLLHVHSRPVEMPTALHGYNILDGPCNAWVQLDRPHIASTVYARDLFVCLILLWDLIKQSL